MNKRILVPLLVLGLLTTQILKGQDTSGSAISQQKFKKLIKKKNTIVLDVGHLVSTGQVLLTGLLILM